MSGELVDVVNDDAPDVWQSYRDAVVRIDTPSGPVVVRPAVLGEAEGDFPDPSGRAVYVITGHNPDGQLASAGDNERAHVRLLRSVHSMGWTYWQAQGGDARWTHVERSVAIVGAHERDVLTLARDLGQQAVFAWTPSAWWLISSDGDRAEMGWTAVRDKESAAVAIAFAIFGMPDGTFKGAFADATVGDRIARCEPHELAGLRKASSVVRSWVERHAQSLERDQRAVRAERRAERQASLERRRTAAAVRAAGAERQRQAYAEHGWQALWSLTDVRTLLENGCTPHSVEPFVAHGWAPHEVLSAARKGLVRDGVVPPEGDAAFHRAMGDQLATLLRGEWPVCPAETAISVKRTWSTGRAERWLFRTMDVGTRVERHRRTAHGWQAPTVWAADGDVTQALRARPALTRLTKGGAHEYVAIDAIDSATVVEVLRVDAAGGDLEPASWPRRAARSWDRLGDDLDMVLDDLARLRRWASVNGQPVACLPAGKRVVPVLVDPEVEVDPSRGELGIVGAKPLASYSWFSESGGAPVSWNGGSGLWTLPGGAVLSRNWGDIDAEQRIIPLPSTPAGVVELLEGWIRQNDSPVSAALALEPFDPRATLSAKATGVWHERFEALTAQVGFSVPDDVRQLLRVRLSRRYAQYRDARRALASPRSAQGLELAAALDDVLETGVLGRGM